MNLMLNHVTETWVIRKSLWGQTDTVCCKRLVTGNDNYTYLRTKPSWTTFQTYCREFVRSLKVCSLPRSKNYKFYSIYKPNLGPTTKKNKKRMCNGLLESKNFVSL